MNNFVQRVNHAGADPGFWNWGGGGWIFGIMLDYMLESVFVGSKWINRLVEQVRRLCTFSTSVREIKYYFNIWGIRKNKERDSEKGGGGENSPFHLPWIRACHHEHSSKTLNGEVDHYRHSFVWGDKFLKCFSKILQKTLGRIMLTIYNAAKIDIIFLGGMDLNP